MKNFSTVGARLAAATLLAGAMGAAAAADCAFRPNAPDQHLVVKGDTLWDISASFLEHPWCWPQVWGMNKDEIRNPHWIYPGQTIYFDREHGRLSLNKPGEGGAAAAPDAPPATRLSPQLRTEGLGKDAIRSIASGIIEPFLSQPLVVEEEELKQAPRIAATEEGRVNLGVNDKAYVAGKLKGGTSFQVFRPGTPLKDPVNGKQLGYEAIYLGTVKLQAEAKNGAGAHTFTVASSSQEMGVGDLLMPAPPTAMLSYVPHPPERPVDAHVMSLYGGTGAAGQNEIVSINRGAFDGIDSGTVLQLYHVGKTVADPGGDKGLLGMRHPTVTLPNEQFGTLFVFRVFKHVSYGLIMQVKTPVEVGDQAISPE